MAKHIVQSGESLSVIASKYGMNWRALYDHPNNAEFRAKRPNPNVIGVGDELWVPGEDEEQKEDSKQTTEAANVQESHSTETSSSEENANNTDPTSESLQFPLDGAFTFEIAATTSNTIQIPKERNIILRLETDKGHRIPKTKFVFLHESGGSLEGVLDDEGLRKLTNIPSGFFEVQYPDLSDISQKSAVALLNEAIEKNDFINAAKALSLPAEDLQNIMALLSSLYGKELVNAVSGLATSPEDELVLDQLLIRLGHNTGSSASLNQYSELKWDDSSVEELKLEDLSWDESKFLKDGSEGEEPSGSGGISLV